MLWQQIFFRMKKRVNRTFSKQITDKGEFKMKVKQFGRGILSLVLLMIFAMSVAVPALAAGYQSDSKDMLNVINKYRTDPNLATYVNLNGQDEHPALKPLKWDNDMAAIARTRAQQVSKYYSHNLANGKTQWSVTSNGKEMYTELICRDQETAEDAVKYWYRPESYTNAAQSNRRDMLDDRITCMGASHYQNDEGRDYWVVVFGQY